MSTRLHSHLKAKDDDTRLHTRVNVFAAIDSRGYGLLFRPLDGLLGLCLKDPSPGILITTKRRLNVQRFTAAHELGHLEMGHEFSLDDEEQIEGPTGKTKKKLQEVAANAFGAEFLMPRWLIRQNMETRDWYSKDLNNPIVVYQLALRLGVSYEAICRTLRRHNWIDDHILSDLLSVKPKDIKLQILNGLTLQDPWADVWLLTEADHNEFLEASENDIFILNLTENGGSGYLWNIDDLSFLGFQVTTIREKNSMNSNIGAPALRSWSISTKDPHSGCVELKERRPWDQNNINSRFIFSYSLLGKEEGMPRMQRQLLRAA